MPRPVLFGFGISRARVIRHDPTKRAQMQGGNVGIISFDFTPTLHSDTAVNSSTTIFKLRGVRTTGLYYDNKRKLSAANRSQDLIVLIGLAISICSEYNCCITPVLEAARIHQPQTLGCAYYPSPSATITKSHSPPYTQPNQKSMPSQKDTTIVSSRYFPSGKFRQPVRPGLILIGTGSLGGALLVVRYVVVFLTSAIPLARLK